MQGNLMHIAEQAQPVADLVPFYCLKYKQQGPTVQHRELYSMSCNKP